MKRFHKPLAVLIFTTLGACAAMAEQPESTIPVAAKTNSEKWWNGNCERINMDIGSNARQVVAIHCRIPSVSYKPPSCDG